MIPDRRGEGDLGVQAQISEVSQTSEIFLEVTPPAGEVGRRRQPRQPVGGQTQQKLLGEAVEKIPLLQAAFIFQRRLGFLGRPGQFVNVAQLESARTVEVILQ